MATEILVSLYVLVGLFSVHAAHSHKGSQGLSCVNDFVNNVSCTWDGAPLAPGVDCWIIGVKTTWILKNYMRYPGTIIRSCKMKRHRKSPPGCSFVFENEEFNSFKDMPYISMECNGTLVENLTNYSPYKHIKMHPPGVPNVSSTANETRISWTPGSPRSHFITSFDFQVQITEKNKTWNDANIQPTQEQELRIPAGRFKGHCHVRVRVKPISQPHKSHWSNWSPTASWVEATDVVVTSQGEDWLLGQSPQIMRGVIFSLGLIIITLVLYKSCANRGLLKGKPVPNPSNYFHTLHSDHGGNLKKWLNPLSASESFFMAQPHDRISPVEVCNSWDVAPSTSPSSGSTSALLHFSSSNTSGAVDNSSSSSSSSSCFSNMGYFMSSSSGGSARTDPNPVYFTYKDDFHNLHNSLHLSLCPSFNSSPTYESLKREPQSPDSGFGIEQENEEDKEGKRVVDVEGKEVSNDHQSPPLLILPVHFPSHVCPPASAPPPPNTPSLSQVYCESQLVDEPVATAGGSYTAWPVAGAMCRSSSMPVEAGKTGYLTLKELQTTFSNKSI